MTGQGLVVFGPESRRTALLRGHSQHSMAAFPSMVVDGFGLVPGLESVTDSTPP